MLPVISRCAIAYCIRFDGLVMNVDHFKDCLLEFTGAVEATHGAPSNILTYKVGGKTFAYFKTSEPERWRFSFRATPDRFLELTGMPGVKPARYMGRYHWVTIVRVAQFQEDYLRELVQWSYDKALSQLSKGKQRELAAGASPEVAPFPEHRDRVRMPTSRHRGE